MPAGDLQNLIKMLESTRRLLSEEFCIYTLLRITTGLHDMHEKNILHQDLNLQNIYLDTNGAIKLGSLGVSLKLAGE